MEMFKFFVVVLLSLFAVSCQVHHIDTNQLIGKSKPEILEIVFAQARRNDNGEVIICVPGYGRGPWGVSLHYKDMETALNDKRLMEAESWEIDHSKGKYKFPVYYEVTAIALFFNGDVVEKTKINVWHLT